MNRREFAKGLGAALTASQVANQAAAQTPDAGATPTLYYVDGYHGGSRGHMPAGSWRDILNAMRSIPEWKISLDIEPALKQAGYDYKGTKDPFTFYVELSGNDLELTVRRASIGKTPENLSAILVTHEHSDHIAGLPVLGRNRDVGAAFFLSLLPRLQVDQYAVLRVRMKFSLHVRLLKGANHPNLIVFKEGSSGLDRDCP